MLSWAALQMPENHPMYVKQMPLCNTLFWFGPQTVSGRRTLLCVYRLTFSGFPGGPQNIKRAFKGLFATTLIALELTLRICFATHWENFKWTLLEWTLQKIAFNAYCISFTWTWVPLNLCVVSTFLKGIFENAEIIMKKRSSVICCKCKFIKHSQMA